MVVCVQKDGESILLSCYPKGYFERIIDGNLKGNLSQNSS